MIEGGKVLDLALGISAVRGEKASKTELDSLLKRARAGDRSAFGKLIERLERRALNLAFAFCGSVADAEEIAQEAFIRLYKYLPRLKDERKFTYWFYRLVINTAKDFLRKRPPRAVSLEGLDGKEAIEAKGPLAPDKALLAQEAGQMLFKALAGLTPKEKSVIILRDLQGLNTKEVAAVLRMGESTVRSHLARARKKIKVFLAKTYKED